MRWSRRRHARRRRALRTFRDLLTKVLKGPNGITLALNMLPPMTGSQRKIQGLSFAYGNLACTTNHKPQLLAFQKFAYARGWTSEEFKVWANDKEWW